QIVLIADPLTADEALRLGLVNQVVEPEALLPAAEQLARRIAANGPLAVRKAKEAMVRSSGRPLEEAFAVESECAREVWRSEDAKEGPRAFLEKRPPRFTGR
ncbi:MAG: enoyl-CoA hydratase/isomerase family protein, partial [Acidimicrobiia bacterium]